MSQQTFLSAIQKVAAGAMSFQDLIAVAQSLAQGGQAVQAQQIYQLWIGQNRDHPLAFVAHFNCSTLQSQLGDEAGGMASLRAALVSNPSFSPAHINLGSALERTGDKAAALEQWRVGLETMAAITGDAVDYKVTLLKQISRVLTDNHQHEASEIVLKQCVDLDPDLRDVSEQYGAVRLAQCKWPAASNDSKLSRRSFVERLHPLSLCAYSDDPLLQLASSARYVDALAPAGSYSLEFDRRNAQIPSDRRLRIGYVSSDLRHHAVGYLTAQLFESHDPRKVETFAYYCGPVAEDALSARMKTSIEHWCDIRGWSDDTAAARIAADEIDILVDVNGHTREARLGVFARRPAPVIVNWLGYPGTMGSAFHNYIVADDFVIPPAFEHYYSETVLRLPCYQPNDRKRVVAEVAPTRADAGLPGDAFVFCSFNAAHKITRFAFERWMRVLQGAPNSVLWLLDYGADTNVRLQREAEARGIAPERLIFAAKVANAHHLARYPLADLVLDTAPYGAHTTASDALWMGVPVVTWSGRCFASRVCGSLLTSAGLPELVCEDADAFVDLAIALATTDRARLTDLRARLRANRDVCALFDIQGLARKLEDLYAHMAQEHRLGHTPRPRLTNLPAYLDVGTGLDHEVREMGRLSDYDGFYKQELERLDAYRPLEADGRLWSAPAAPAASGPRIRLAG
jgi:predicted O-linked N-acetylglucosamine transferase (SPINDLY family)